MKIGVFDSGYGGLTILDKMRHLLPQYDYVYLGDNARTPYGTRSFEVIYEYTLQAVRYLQRQGCRLIILACNTASAKALRTIQQHDIDPDRLRVLGVIRPTVEATMQSLHAQQTTPDYHIGILATPGTVSSNSYVLELEKQTSLNAPLAAPNLHIAQQPCPLWVPLIEAGEHRSDGADYFVREYIQAIHDRDPQLDTLILGCTHYPLLLDKISAAVRDIFPDKNVRLVCQGDIVAQSLRDYLCRHAEIAEVLTTGGTCRYLTTESAAKFAESAAIFLSDTVQAEHIELQ